MRAGQIVLPVRDNGRGLAPRAKQKTIYFAEMFGLTTGGFVLARTASHHSTFKMARINLSLRSMVREQQPSIEAISSLE